MYKNMRDGEKISRTSMTRTNVYTYNQYTCAWCGCVRTTKTDEKYLYRYESVHSRLLSTNVRLFCCLDCYRAYYQ